ncbi:MAG: 50S ribosomal protein L18 [Thermodesulfobacteriota bacterium]
MIKRISRKEKSEIRHKRSRRKAVRFSPVPRLSVFKSARHIYAQIIDDINGYTLVAASSLSPQVREIIKQDKKKKVEIAKIVGRHIAEISLSNGIKKVYFDRGGYPYHGRVRSVAEGAREAGLEF